MKRKESAPGSIHDRFFKTTTVLLLCAIMSAFAGCDEEEVEPQPTGIMGTVFPLGIGATVKIMRSGSVLASVDVDSEGGYMVLDMAEGEYNLMLLADGYMSYSQPITVTEEQITEVEEIMLKEVKKLPGTVTITGKVTDSKTSEPIADALVECGLDDTKTFTYTKKDGSFAISIQPDLVSNITISKTGYESSEIPTADVDTVEVSLTELPGSVPPPSGAMGLNVGDVAPDFTLPKLDGGTMSLHDTRGKVVLIDFWATWCGPCKAAIPHVQKLYEKHKSKGFVVLGVDVWEREGKDVVKKFRDDYGLTYDILLDTDGTVPDLYQVRGIPSAWLLDRNGIIVWSKLGFGPGGEVELEKQILAALAFEPLPEQQAVPAIASREIAFVSR
jgi:thiol-disulfide isomerase/thioredoxin